MTTRQHPVSASDGSAQPDAEASTVVEVVVSAMSGRCTIRTLLLLAAACIVVSSLIIVGFSLYMIAEIYAFFHLPHPDDDAYYLAALGYYVAGFMIIAAVVHLVCLGLVARCASPGLGRPCGRWWLAFAMLVCCVLIGVDVAMLVTCAKGHFPKGAARQALFVTGYEIGVVGLCISLVVLVLLWRGGHGTGAAATVVSSDMDPLLFSDRDLFAPATDTVTAAAPAAKTLEDVRCPAVVALVPIQRAPPS